MYHAAYPDWKFILAQAPSHRLEGYDVNQFNSDTFAQLVAASDTDFVFSFIRQSLEKEYIQNSVVVLDFYWPGELSQILFAAKYLKEHGDNTIILDASG